MAWYGNRSYHWILAATTTNPMPTKARWLTTLEKMVKMLPFSSCPGMLTLNVVYVRVLMWTEQCAYTLHMQHQQQQKPYYLTPLRRNYYYNIWMLGDSLWLLFFCVQFFWSLQEKHIKPIGAPCFDWRGRANNMLANERKTVKLAISIVL